MNLKLSVAPMSRDIYWETMEWQLRAAAVYAFINYPNNLENIFFSFWRWLSLACWTTRSSRDIAASSGTTYKPTKCIVNIQCEPTFWQFCRTSTALEYSPNWQSAWPLRKRAFTLSVSISRISSQCSFADRACPTFNSQSDVLSSNESFNDCTAVVSSSDAPSMLFTKSNPFYNTHMNTAVTIETFKYADKAPA